MSEVMTIRVDRKTKSRLEKLAKAMERSKSYVAAEAIRAYVIFRANQSLVESQHAGH